ncbi:hypothetical protein KC887_02740 [Candidatus Kaiserbacteria bacterium]|nr:hypothetical protein [Candidatus Kaiserbacteria bacterium]
MAKTEVVVVTEAGAGKKYMASNLKALPPAQAGQTITVMAGKYAEGLVAEGLVTFVAPAEPETVETAVPTDDLTTISSLGKSSAAKLADAEVTTFAGLVAADAAELAEATGIAQSKIEEWQAAAVTADEEGE